MLRRRRPLMRAAMVGGGAYVAGKKVQQGREQEADQDARLDDVENQQAPPAATPAPAGGGTSDMLEQLEKLGELRKQGVLTDAEFDAQKQKLLQST
jgi:putative oligomerization/nucleic acid binding protein